MKSKNLKLFYIHEAFFQFSDSMLIIVLPVFIYKLFGNVSAYFIFALIWNLIYISLLLPIFNKAMSWGKPKYFMVIGIILYITSLILFSKTTQENIWMIIPATIAFSLYISFYWMVRHWFFSVNADHEQIGKQISYLGIIRIVISFIAPIIGGYVSFFISFNASFLLGSIAGIISLIPIFLFHAPPHTEKYDWRKIRQILKKPELKTIRPAYFWEGFANYFINNAWILVFTIFIGNIKSFGILVGITTLTATLLTRLAGHLFDKKGRVKTLIYLTMSRVFGTLLYASVFFYPKIIYIWCIELFNRFAGNMHLTFTDSYLFGFSNKIHPVHFHLNREINLSLARIISCIFLATIFFFLPADFLWVTIALGSFTLLGWISLKRMDHLL